jgi:hypothetical protein
MFKDQLMDALHEAVSHFNSGLDDNASVVKAASDFDFNKDQTLRLMETYNTAKTIDFFKKAEDRSQSFSTAEAEKVLPAIFSDDAVLKAAAPAEYPDYDFYEESDGYSCKKASGIDLPDEPTEFHDDSMESLSHRAMSQINELKKTAQYFDDQKNLMGELYDRFLQKIATTLKPGYLEEHEFPKAEVALHILFKEAGDHIAEELTAYIPKDVRRATDIEKSAKICSYDMENPTVTALLKKAHEARGHWSQFAALSTQYAKEAADYEEGFLKASSLETEETAAYREIGEIFTPGFLGGLKSSAESKTEETYSSPFASMAGSAANTIEGGLNVADKVIGPAADKAMKSVGLPKVDVAAALKAPRERESKKIGNKMKNLQRQLILEELITTDPVLKGEEPESVSRAYQTLIQVAPEISLNREVARSILRQSVQSVAVSPFDAKSWADLESEIRKRVRQGSVTSEGVK